MGFSITELLLTGAVLVAVWWGLRRFSAVSARGADRIVRERAKKPPARGGQLDLQPCPRCGTYIARGSACRACAAGG